MYIVPGTCLFLLPYIAFGQHLALIWFDPVSHTEELVYLCDLLIGIMYQVNYFKKYKMTLRYIFLSQAWVPASVGTHAEPYRTAGCSRCLCIHGSYHQHYHYFGRYLEVPEELKELLAGTNKPCKSLSAIYTPYKWEKLLILSNCSCVLAPMHMLKIAPCAGIILTPLGRTYSETVQHRPLLGWLMAI